MTIPSSITEQVDTVKDLEISYRMLHNFAILNNESSSIKTEIPFESLVNKYRDILSKIVINVNLDDKLSRRYLYQPKLLSYDLYNTVELWAELLRLNNWTTITQFKPINKIKIYDPNKLKAFLNEILILEEKL
jgi:hypothetical protein